MMNGKAAISLVLGLLEAKYGAMPGVRSSRREGYRRDAAWLDDARRRIRL